MKRFALIGAAGYIAPRHMKAIKDTGNELVAAMDPNDSVGIIDSFFPEAAFFTEFERFDRHLDMLKRSGKGVDYVAICSPNYLHDAHIRFGLRSGADVICEKPLVLNPWNVEGLKEIEKETGHKIYNILQLRLHDSIIALKKMVDAQKGKRHQIKLHYMTSRGKWYHYSWKGNMKKSGGIATNIGVHFFDMLNWIFGPVENIEVYQHDNEIARGKMTLAKGDVDWLLSIDYNQLPEDIKAKGQRTYRSITVDEVELEFSQGFSKLHTRSYADILNGGGFGIEAAEAAIQMVHDIRPKT